MSDNAESIGDQPFGFWVLIHNEASAKWAIKMSGLVTFYLGLLMLFIATISIFQTIGMRLDFKNILEAWSTVGPLLYAIIPAGILLIIAGLKIRAGSTAWLLATAPVIVCYFILLLILNLYIGAIIYAFHLILLISGLRGWWWLKTHQDKSSNA